MSTCRSCGATIVWAITDSGKRMPVDAEPDPAGNLSIWESGEGWRVTVVPEEWDGLRYRPHFATCPDSESWRRGR